MHTTTKRNIPSSIPGKSTDCEKKELEQHNPVREVKTFLTICLRR